MSDEERGLIQNNSEGGNFWDTKKEQASDFVRSLGKLLGGDEERGFIAIGAGLGLVFFGKIKNFFKDRKQKEKERLYQESLKKHEAQIQDLKRDAAECNEKQTYFMAVIEALSRRRGEDNEG